MPLVAKLIFSAVLAVLSILPFLGIYCMLYIALTNPREPEHTSEIILNNLATFLLIVAYGGCIGIFVMWGLTIWSS